jgi:hypothetical protein
MVQGGFEMIITIKCRPKKWWHIFLSDSRKEVKLRNILFEKWWKLNMDRKFSEMVREGIEFVDNEVERMVKE